MEFMHTKLDNGLVVVGERNEAAQSMACGFFVKTGSRDETPEESGVSHFLEHMMFKGGRPGENIHQQFRSIGAWYNASTSSENTIFYGRVLPEFQLRFIAQLTNLLRPALRKEDFETEKKVVLEEIAMCADSPKATVIMKGLKAFANGHPSGNNVLGESESIEALERDQMAAYYERRYSPSNMLFALTGAFDWDGAVQQVEEATRGWPVFKVGREYPPHHCIYQTHIAQNDALSREHLRWYWQGPSCQDDKRRAAEVLSSVLGGAVGSRMYWSLVDSGLAKSASMGAYAADQYGFYSARAECSPNRAGEVVRKVQDIFRDAAENGVAHDEVDRAKQKIASSLVLRSETPMRRLTPLGIEWTYRKKYLDTDEAVNRLLSVTKEDVEALLAEDPFAKGTLVALGPLETLEI